MKRLKISEFLRSGAAKTLVSYLVGFATQGVYFIVLARALGAQEFGLWAGALALTAVFSGLVGLGSGQVLVLQAANDRHLLNSQLGTALVYIIISAVPFGLIAWLLGIYTSPEFVRVLLPLLFSELVAVRIFDLAIQVFQACDDMTRNSVCRIMGGAVRVGGLFVAWSAGLGDAITWSIWYAVITACSALLSLGWAVRFHGAPKLSLTSLRNTWRSGTFFALGMSSRTIYMEADKYILNKFLFIDFAGAMSASTRIVTMAFAPIQAIVYSSNTTFFREGRNGPEALWRSMKRPLLFSILYAVAAAILVIICAPLVPIVLGDSYQEASQMLYWLAWALLFNGIHYLFGDALMGLGKQAIRSVAQFLIAAVSVGANIVLIPLFGPSVAIFVSLACSCLLALFMLFMFIAVYKRESGQNELQSLEV
ncbi:lipopolysaccharide biosynthesis protein [Arthrobacter sp. VKM Ac-2550]|uniref:lipopolysaccharide biosynthesis protein n=1 Tax=Crystallibacter permensis TaxID=1938888 RepID=UPI002227F390|nr:oligosaccharide flippase family protein [Arthrobacter sp. VKM Ac-2550]MCW2135348.1 Membrane protein involved in the export of O-antigen and teichoic acid [Arthrobacter sp. VKM Ac-2550]